MSNLATKSVIVKSGTKSDITESKEGEAMTTTSAASGAYTRAGELQAASCKRAESSIRGAVISETASYIYTREVVSYTEDWYFIDFKLNDGRKAMGCTVYHTMEAAQTNVTHEATIFGHNKENASIRKEQHNGFKVIRHRYKKG
jgi:hypothetical protein